MSLKYNYTRCQYFSQENNIQCEMWYGSQEHDKYCLIHRDVINPSLAAQGLNKESFIDQSNRVRKYAYEMNLQELTEHINQIETIVEHERVTLLNLRGVLSDKKQKMTDEEREELRKLKTSDFILKPLKEPKVSKKDPVKDIMKVFETMGTPISLEAAMAMISSQKESLS